MSIKVTVQCKTANPIEIGWQCVGQWNGEYYHRKEIEQHRIHKVGQTYCFDIETSANNQTPLAVATKGLKNNERWYLKFNKEGKEKIKRGT